jgi:uncharacterized protein (TIGR00299 family) protein
MIAWIDATAGASGDMLLGALVDAGVPLDVLSSAVSAVAPEPIRLVQTEVHRAGLRASLGRVEVADSSTHRTWADVSELLAEAPLDEPVRHLATQVFERLAVAEAAVHGIDIDAVHFHEVGALDAIADVVGVCAGFVHLDADEVVVSPIAVGSGRTSAEHGDLPVPVPAVTELLRGAPSYAGPGTAESCTPTGAALLTTVATSYGPQPPMTTTTVGIGAGGRDPGTHANVLRILVGEPVTAPIEPAETQPQAIVLETNVDDLDPRLWPDVIRALLDAGASDAWLTPILMKKGRPAHTLSVLVAPDHLPEVRREVFRQTSTIGVREIPYGKTALDRETRSVEVAGHHVRVKVASLEGEVLNVQPEYDDVARVAAETGRPIKDVLAEAAAAARPLPR